MYPFLISAAFEGVIPNRVKLLLTGGTYSDLSGDGVVLIKGLCLYEVQHLLEEIHYMYF